ncbi:MAG: PH domain-containing protein [Acidobacteriota bacterium]|nr:PH domain-containing protein [Acidobacteriota bacterium]NLH68575.1 PH domain-containing protein [Brooklawnia sp.]
MKLDQGEEVVTTTRPHAQVLIWPILALLIISALVGVGFAVVPVAERQWGWLVVAGVGALLTLFGVLNPLLRWASTTTTLTTQRLSTRSGLLWRTGYDLPLNRVVDVAYRRRLGDFGFGSGTLLLTTVAGQLLRLDHLPRIKDMHQAVSELVADLAPVTESEEPWR